MTEDPYQPDLHEPEPHEPDQAVAEDAASGTGAGADKGQTGQPVTTGHPAVDEVLRSMERLDERPVVEHVPAFEEAHETLRRSLASGDSSAE